MSRSPRKTRIALAGNAGVGKSAIAVQFVQNLWIRKYDPTIEDCYRKLVDVDGEQTMLEIFDTSGTNQFTWDHDFHWARCEGFVLVYSVIAPSTFKEIKDFHERIVRGREEEQIQFVLVGNKCDLTDQRVITTEEGQNLAKEFGFHFFEVSAKKKLNVEEVFSDLVRQIRALPSPQQFHQPPQRNSCLLF